jgi:hypothetical protein
MKPCAICRQPIKPATPTVELVGGLFDPADPAFFVVDETVMAVSHVHRDCMLQKLKRP